MTQRDRCEFCNTVYILRTGDTYGTCPRCQRDTLRNRIARAQGSLCSMRDGFRANGEDSYGDRTQYVIELLMGNECSKGGEHVPTRKLSATICEKCCEVLEEHPPLKIPAGVSDPGEHPGS